MLNSQIINWIVLGVLAFWAVGAGGRLVRLRQAISAAWDLAQAQMRRRSEALDHLLSSFAARLPDAQARTERVVAARGQCHALAELVSACPQDAVSVRSLMLAERLLESELQAWLDWTQARQPQENPGAEPTELIRHVEQLDDSVAQLNLARLHFNAAARAYNDAVCQFPTSLLARLGRFRPAEYLRTPDAPLAEPAVTPEVAAQS